MAHALQRWSFASLVLLFSNAALAAPHVASNNTSGLFRREGNLDNTQTVSDSTKVWRAFACMVPFTASDNTPLLMLYGGTSSGSAKDPLKVAKDGLSELLIFDTTKNKWHAPNTANAPRNGPVLPGCGASPGNIWVYDPQYGQTDKEAMTVSLLDSVHWSWSTPSQQGQLPVTRFGAAFAYVPSTQAFFMHGGVPLSGNSNTAENPPGIANNLDILAPSGLSWTYKQNGPARKYHTLCYLSSIDSVVLFGGSDQNVASYNDVKMFSIKKGTWTYDVVPSGPKPAERILHSAVCSDDSMYVFGGLQSAGSAPSDSTVWVLKASSDGKLAWSTAPISSSSQNNGPTARAGHSAALLNNNMYIYGGIGPSGQDSTMYKLDLTKWEWSTSSLNGDKEDSKNKSRSITAVLIAAIISSVFGVLTIGIAATVIYRWSRRRQIAARLFNRGGGQGNDSDSDSDSEYINDNDIARDSREKGDGTQLKGNESMIATSAKEADYPSHTQSSHIGAAFDNDSASSYADKTTPVKGAETIKKAEIFASSSSSDSSPVSNSRSGLLDSKIHSKPLSIDNLASSANSLLASSDPDSSAARTAHLLLASNAARKSSLGSRSGSTIIDQQSATNMYGSDHHRLENEYRHAELINQILLSEQPIPAWLLDAVNQAEANNQSEQRTPASNDEDESDEQSQPRQPSKSLKVANRS